MRKIKILALGLLVCFLGIGATYRSSGELSYTYSITSSGYSAGEIIELYQTKEYLVDSFKKLTFGIPKSLHLTVISDNLEQIKKFDNSTISLMAGEIVIIINGGKGQTLSGNLQSSECDSEVVNQKVYLFDWLFGW